MPPGLPDNRDGSQELFHGIYTGSWTYDSLAVATSVGKATAMLFLAVSCTSLHHTSVEIESGGTVLLYASSVLRLKP